jgi:four helix bundle protein
MRDHRKLRAFELADNLVLQTYRVTQDFPKAEQFGLTMQMRRAAVSTACNIVEGCARHSENDYLRFLDMAYGSACEVTYQASVAFRLGFLSEASYQSFADAAKETSRVLNGLISSLRSGV